MKISDESFIIVGGDIPTRGDTPMMLLIPCIGVASMFVDAEACSVSLNFWSFGGRRPFSTLRGGLESETRFKAC